MKPKHDPQVYVELAEQGFSNYAIAKEFGVDEATVRRGLRRIGYQRSKIPDDVTDSIELDSPLIHVGSAVVCADLHVPLIDAKLANDMIERAAAEKVYSLIIAGDFFHFDALSQYYPKQDGDGGDLWFELKTGIKVMRVLLQVFDEIYYLWGNHDARLHKALGFKIKFDNAMRVVFGELGEEALRKIKFSPLDHMWVKPTDDAQPDNSWYVCHPEAYTQVPLSKGRIIADKMNSNVITAHSHHCAVGYARDGKKVVVEVGGLFDATKTAYLQRSTSYPNWTQGFCVLRKKGDVLQPKIYSPGWEV